MKILYIYLGVLQQSIRGSSIVFIVTYQTNMSLDELPVVDRWKDG